MCAHIIRLHHELDCVEKLLFHPFPLSDNLYPTLALMSFVALVLPGVDPNPGFLGGGYRGAIQRTDQKNREKCLRRASCFRGIRASGVPVTEGTPGALIWSTVVRGYYALETMAMHVTADSPYTQAPSLVSTFPFPLFALSPLSS